MTTKWKAFLSGILAASALVFLAAADPYYAQAAILDQPLGGQFCGNGTCGTNENRYNCPQDCGTNASCQKEGQFCGGIAPGAFQCCSGLVCRLDGNYPDAGGKCVKDTQCPAPKSKGNCIARITWAKNPLNGHCCRYAGPCYAPANWKKFTTQKACQRVICGDRICETGEADYCPPCVYSNPPCKVACKVGTCPRDCAR